MPLQARARNGLTSVGKIARPQSVEQKIIADAQVEFVRASFAGARTRDIVDAAGVNETTLFKYFPTKQVFFEEAVMRPLAGE